MVCLGEAMAKGGVLLIIYVAIALIAGGGRGVEGIQLVGEEVEVITVENGTAEAIVLDCPYEVEDDDKLEDIVIKWYFREQIVHFYQWIPSEPSPPQVTDKFLGYVDTSYRVDVEGDDTAHIHRAIKLLNPTTELTGDYFCHISSFHNDKTGKRKLVVYTKPEVTVQTDKVEVEVEGGRKENGVEVKCDVDGMYPQPSISITHVLTEGGNRHTLPKLDVTTSAGEGVYRAHAKGRVSDAVLDSTTVFWCNISVPGTDLNFANHTKYQPSRIVLEGAARQGTEGVHFSVVPLLLVTLLVLKYL